MRAAYSLLFLLVFWCLLVPWHLFQILVGRLDAAALRQRMGRWNLPEKSGRLRIIVHAVSVGEVLSAERLMGEILKHNPRIGIILTTGTKDGLGVAQQLQRRLPEIEATGFLPWDCRGALYRWLSECRPDLVITVETEIWPNLFLTSRQLKIPVCIVSGRIYPADLTYYQILPSFFKDVLSCAAWIGVQNETEKTRFIRIGAPTDRIEVSGNLKMDCLPDGPDIPPAQSRHLHTNDLVLTAASTHAPEERMILECFLQLKNNFANLKLILAPRHVKRSIQLESLAKRCGFRAARWSDLSRMPEWEVLILDEFGWLAPIYKHSSVVIMGGTFARRGGHNFLEAAARECAVVMGPNTLNFEHLVREFRDCQAVVQLDAAENLGPILRELFENEIVRRDLGRRARLALEARQGASRACALAVASILEAHKCNQTSGLLRKMSSRY